MLMHKMLLRFVLAFITQPSWWFYTRLKCCKTFQSLFQPLFHNQNYAIDCALLFEPCERKMGDFV